MSTRIINYVNIYLRHQYEFLPLSRKHSSGRNVPRGEEWGETDVFAGYKIYAQLFLSFEQSFLDKNPWVSDNQI